MRFELPEQRKTIEAALRNDCARHGRLKYHWCRGVGDFRPGRLGQQFGDDYGFEFAHVEEMIVLFHACTKPHFVSVVKLNCADNCDLNLAVRCASIPC